MTSLNSVISIRPARAGDEVALAPLLAQLGYASDTPALAGRIAQFVDQTRDRVLVADRDGQAVACISLHWLDCFHVASRLGRITSLVVDEHCRGQRIGALLVAAGEAWLRKQGCGRGELTSNAERLDAHRFYHAQGYAIDSQRFVKTLAHRGAARSQHAA
jgi:N-acetylglutamate synthase-like GNAT family acetyltransferase